ncbi:TPA: hypothetical protein DCZ46_03340 [Candidatus Campbellbacteria bacterium]|nr:MAG: hypothetical protein UR58_C0001G0638 [Candidatus Campbellbacteria bacterium GW2011_OD1_34_28]KKP74836.1 MAG: hypothetical protein UR74_C0002G0102 [Candidatus Campbellbacteria bacterium GW2011_GWD2_35_24]KKP75722.1 MAG: hypothetical protein UR75_C0002G0103 [Candidatus Campbellbacteria bacterium GW2011_GWC2_35_28]KKP77030.1 MAG: hypothetical protein UR76_C0002G0231 [Candidatus Campbellbacteria bacterium GW2011_GWC1_35_31]KKP78956.1 MAG: hypothetical protein UR79_C0002G0231 [Candidatus Cam
MHSLAKERKISFSEFLEIMKKAYLETTFASEESFEKSTTHLREIYDERLRVAGEMTVDFADVCAEIHTKLDPGL